MGYDRRPGVSVPSMDRKHCTENKARRAGRRGRPYFEPLFTRRRRLRDASDSVLQLGPDEKAYRIPLRGRRAYPNKREARREPRARRETRAGQDAYINTMFNKSMGYGLQPPLKD